MIITRTPLRISFIGGGTDLKCFYEKHGGAIVNAAIDKYVYVMVRERLLDQPRQDTDFEREAKKMVGVDDVVIYTWSDLPAGTGLGSSGSYLVGLLHALHVYKGDKINRKQLAEEAYVIETEILDAPVGKQDQYIAAYGGIKYWEFSKCGLVSWKKIIDEDNTNRLSKNLMLLYLGVTRKSSSILKEQVKNNDKITPHLIKVRDLAVSCNTNLDYYEIGEVMNLGWEEKIHFASNITSPTIDALLDKAIKSGVLGAKVVGAGGGGFLLLYVGEWLQREIREALNLTEVKFNIVNKGTEVLWT